MELRAIWAQQCAAWVRVGDRPAILYPIVAVAIMTAVSSIAIQVASVSLFISPFVALVAIMANRVCVRAGLLTVLLTIPIYNYLFAGAPHSGFQIPSWGEVAAYVSMFAAALMVAPRRMPPAGRVYDAGTDLPFTSNGENGGRGNGGLHGNGIRYWDVLPTWDWKEDCEVGSEYARIFMERVRADEPRPMLAWIARDMVMRGPSLYSGVEVGFMQGLMAHCASGRQHNADDGRVS